MRVSAASVARNWRSAPIGVATVFFSLVLVFAAAAQSSGSQDAWKLDPSASNLTFQSIKKGTIVETSKFVTFDGMIEPDGAATINVLLESVDTGVDLRNVRMRFLFFETYKNPKATITAKVDPAILDELKSKHRLQMDLDYRVSLHGVDKDMKSPVIVQMIDPNVVSISSAVPINIPVADFNLAENITKLEQAVGNITITPTTSVSFNFVFNGPAIAVAATPQAPVPGQDDSNINTQECKTRFDVLSQTQAIYFRSGSYQLQEESLPLLETVVKIAKECHDLKLEVAGYTDSDGQDEMNQKLSEQRARVVAYYLNKRGIEPDRVTDVGFGEQNPVAPNDTRANKARNRRIEFHASGG